MARTAIQFLKGLSLPAFHRLDGTEEQCEAALEKGRWPDEFRCPRCNGHEQWLIDGRQLKRDECCTCGHQATLTAGTILQAAGSTTNFLNLTSRSGMVLEDTHLGIHAAM